MFRFTAASLSHKDKQMFNNRQSAKVSCVLFGYLSQEEKLGIFFIMHCSKNRIPSLFLSPHVELVFQVFIKHSAIIQLAGWQTVSASLRIFSLPRLCVDGMKTSSDVKLWSNGGSSCFTLNCSISILTGVLFSHHNSVSGGVVEVLTNFWPEILILGGVSEDRVGWELILSRNWTHDYCVASLIKPSSSSLHCSRLDGADRTSTIW